jgi:hypothetical protein
MDEIIVKVGRFLFYNPWSPQSLIVRLTGLGRDGASVLGDRAIFERVRIPCWNARGYQDVYGLTAKAQIELTGLSRPPRALGEALLMQYGRLERARQVLAELARAGRLLWSISPWRATPRAPCWDALLAVERGQGQASLAGLVIPMQNASLEWYLDVLACWARWRKASCAIPAMLILWNPPLGALARKYLSELTPGDTQSPVVCFFGEALSGIGRFEPLESRLKGREPRFDWVQPARVPAELLLQEAFSPDARRRRIPKAGTLSSWAGKDASELAYSLSFFYRAHAGEIQLLETLARFPGLTALGYRQLNREKKAGRALARRLSALVSAELVAEVQEPAAGLPTRYFLAERGLVLLSGLVGVGERAWNRYLGWPLRPGQFRQERQHMGITLDFMLGLQREGVLPAWDFTAARYVYAAFERPMGGKTQRLVILPDSAGAILLSHRRWCLFWLEVDRGTRRGKSLTWKLEKYFLAQFARLISGPIPPLIYLVATPNGRDEKRLRFVAHTLLRLGEKYPGAHFTAVLVTGELLGRSRAPILEARIWRRFYRDAFNPELVSLREAFGKER